MYCVWLVCLVDSTQEKKKFMEFLQCVKTGTKRRNKINWNKFIWFIEKKKKYIYIYIYILRWRNFFLSVKVEKFFFFFTVKSWKKKIKKINFINLFGHEEKKIWF